MRRRSPRPRANRNPCRDRERTVSARIHSSAGNPAEAPVDTGPVPAENNEDHAAPPHVIGVDPAGFAMIEASDNEQSAEASAGEATSRRHSDDAESESEAEDEEHVEQIGGDAMEEVPSRPYRPRRQYKI